MQPGKSVLGTPVHQQENGAEQYMGGKIFHCRQLEDSWRMGTVEEHPKMGSMADELQRALTAESTQIQQPIKEKQPCESGSNASHNTQGTEGLNAQHRKFRIAVAIANLQQGRSRVAGREQVLENGYEEPWQTSSALTKGQEAIAELTTTCPDIPGFGTTVLLVSRLEKHNRFYYKTKVRCLTFKDL